MLHALDLTVIGRYFLTYERDIGGRF